MKIEFDGREITLKRTLRSLMMFENITSRSFTIGTTTDVLTYFYAVVLCSDKDVDLTFEKFIDILDEQPTLLEEFQKWLIEDNEKSQNLSKKKTTKPKEKH